MVCESLWLYFLFYYGKPKMNLKPSIQYSLFYDISNEKTGKQKKEELHT